MADSSISEQEAEKWEMSGLLWLCLGVCAAFCFSEFSDSGQGWE